MRVLFLAQAQILQWQRTEILVSSVFGGKKIRRNSECIVWSFLESKTIKSYGICLDQAQINILERSWRCSLPERLSAFKDEYRHIFQIHESAQAMFQVPLLDDLLEPMLNKRHGNKSGRGWWQGKTLTSQPLKAIESIAYQKTLASRYGLIAITYIQQALGTL